MIKFWKYTHISHIQLYLIQMDGKFNIKVGQSFPNHIIYLLSINLIGKARCNRKIEWNWFIVLTMFSTVTEMIRKLDLIIIPDNKHNEK